MSDVCCPVVQRAALTPRGDKHSTFGRDWRRIAYVGCVLVNPHVFCALHKTASGPRQNSRQPPTVKKKPTPRSDPSRTPRARFATARSVVIAPRVTSSAELITMPCARVHLIDSCAIVRVEAVAQPTSARVARRGRRASACVGSHRARASNDSHCV